MNLEIPTAIISSMVGGGITALASVLKNAHDNDKAVAVVKNEINRIDSARLLCQSNHAKINENVVKHHEDKEVHVSNAWRDEIRSRFDRIEELQDKVLAKLLENGQ